MRTIGKHFHHRSHPQDETVARDDYSGVPNYRSKLDRDGSGMLRDARKRERDKATLQELERMNAEANRRPSYAHDGGAGMVDVEPPASLETVLEHAGQFWGPDDD